MKLKSGGFPKGLVSYWTMDNVSGNTLVDEKGINNGTIYGATQVDGKIGKALSFDGVDDYVQMDSSSSSKAISSLTISTWIKTDSTAPDTDVSSRIVGIYRANVVSKVIINQRKDYIQFWWFDANAVSVILNSITTLNNGNWYNIIVTHNGSEAKLFIDGVLEAQNLSTSLNNSITTFGDTIGSGVTGHQPFNGSIDDVMIFNRALTEDEIKKIYKIGLNKFKIKVKGNSLNEGLVGYWTMDNVSGSDLIADKGNNGTIYGATQVDGKLDKALSFDGTDDYVNTTTDFIDETPFTFCSWFYPNNINTDAGIVIQSNSVGNSNGVILTGQRFVSLVRKEGGVGVAYYSPSNVFNLNQWNFVAGTWDGTNAKIFVNGIEYIGGSRASISNATANITFIGRNQYASGAGNKYFNGSIDEVMIYNRALSLEEIQRLYNNGLGKYKPLNKNNNLVNVKKLDSSSLVSYWTMDEINGTTLIDKMGVNNGTISGATQVDGKIGKALSFDGVDDYVSVADSESLEPTDITISMWIKPDSWLIGTIGNSLITKRTTFTDGFWLFYFEGALHWDFGGNQQGANPTRWNTGYSPALNTWTQITVVRNSSGRYLYVNGVLNNSTTYSGRPDLVPSIAPLKIGMDTMSNQYYFDGLIDDTMIYNRALSLEEIQRLYNNGLGKYKPFDNKIKIGG